jgi:hypothetical protein
MVDFYSDMQGVASAVIGEFAQGTISYVALTNNGLSPDNPGEPIEVVTTVPGVVRGVQFKFIDGTNIFASDGQITIPADTGIVPSITGFIEVDGRRHKIVSASAIPPAGTTVAYRVIYRR